MLNTVHLSSNPGGISAVDKSPWVWATADRGNRQDLSVMDIMLAKLIDDREMENRLRYGVAINDKIIYDHDSSWRDAMASWLIPAIAGLETCIMTTTDIPAGTSDVDIAFVAALIFRYLRTDRHLDDRENLIPKMLFSMPRVFHLDGYALASMVVSNPSLLAEYPELRIAETYGSAYELVRATGSSEVLNSIKGGKKLTGRPRIFTEDAKNMLLSVLMKPVTVIPDDPDSDWI
jgi:hypothetical protein